MSLLRLARWNRWILTGSAVLATASALAAAAAPIQAKPLWELGLFPLSLATLAAAAWRAPLDVKQPIPLATQRHLWALFAVATLCVGLKLYLAACVRSACVAM